MSILDKLFRKGMEDQIDKIPNMPVGGDGRDTVYADDVVGYIMGELERRRSDRVGLELQWNLNSNFLAGYGKGKARLQPNCPADGDTPC